MIIDRSSEEFKKFKNIISRYYCIPNDDYYYSLNEKQREVFDRFFEDIVYSDNKTVGELTEREVFILRKTMKDANFTDLAKECGVSITCVRNNFYKSLKVIIKSCNRGYMNLSDCKEQAVDIVLEHLLLGEECHYGYVVCDSLKEKQNKQRMQIVAELKDTSRSNVECLSDLQTEILRRVTGVYGKAESQQQACSNLGLTYAVCRERYVEALKAIIKRITRGCVDIEKAFRNGEITKEELLDIPVCVSSNLDNRIITALSHHFDDGFRYSELNIVDKSLFDRIRGLGSKSVQILLQHLNNLSFPLVSDEIDMLDEIETEEDYLDDDPVEDFIDEHDDYDEKYDADMDDVIEEKDSKAEKLSEIRSLLLELAECCKEEIENKKEIDTLIKKAEELSIKKAQLLIKVEEATSVKDVNKRTLR